MQATERRERPIIFSGEMVRAILDGRKTMTRRVVKPRYGKNPRDLDGGNLRTNIDAPFEQYAAGGIWTELKCPYGKPGDLLWLRESHWRWTGCGEPPARFVRDRCYDDYSELASLNEGCCLLRVPSIHMPRWASRITLEVTDVQVERVQDISEEDAEAEGAEYLTHPDNDDDPDGWENAQNGYFPQRTYEDGFHLLWDTLNAKRGYSWASNPWVWIVEFKQVEATA